jgi:hypothetical protein
MINGFLVLEDGRVQQLGVIERWEAVTEALQTLAQQVERFAADQKRKKDLIANLTSEELEKLIKATE